ncbi:hypothetical protein ON010_g17231 [Phytophthora cinnamomi]|nr:hypothetical protein ON010_g17231 [Phytophthora cinnamomi]
MDMWSLGCVLLECVSGKPLFTLPAVESSVQERAEVATLENDDLLQQIECVVTNGVPLDAACAPYRSAMRYEVAEGKSTTKQDMTSLQTRLEAAAPGNRHFHDFIYSLLDVNPATRATAKQALFHPFLQAFFPFGTVFAHFSTPDAGRNSESAAKVAQCATVSGAKRKARVEAAQKHFSRTRKKKSAERAASARSKDLRQVLKIIPRDVPGRSSLSPR